MLEVICWKWNQPGYRSKFTGEHVNVLRSMVRRHYQKPHRFSCITDDPKGIDKDIRIIPLWPDHGDLPNPSFRNGPSCFRRLRVFSQQARQLIGERFVSLDLDVVITRDLAPLWDRDEDFIIWGDTLPGYWYNGSMFMMNAGARAKVWETFDPIQSPKAATRAGRKGSDQAWISHCLGPGEKTWNRADGVYSFRNHLKEGLKPLPNDARIVIMHGAIDPWSPRAQRLAWVKEHWC
jgi:hypothetical protein